MSIELSEEVYTFTRTKEETETIYKSLSATSTRQSKLGLGDSSNFVKYYETNARAACVIQSFKEYTTGENKIFSFVASPDQKIFPRFRGSGQITQASLQRKPEFAFTELTEKTQKVQVSAGGRTYNANIPIMPLFALERAEKVLEIDPSAKFHLIFQPMWEEQPQLDPVLLAELGGEGTDIWLKVAAWDSDAEVIESFLQSK